MEPIARAAAQTEAVGQDRTGVVPPGAGPLTIFYDSAWNAESRRLSATSAPFGNRTHEMVPETPLTLRPVTVLIAEDNDDLRQIMEIFLGMAGYSVVACSDAFLAAEAFRSRTDIDLLITDLQMPGKSGAELARELTGLCPSLPVMIISGGFISGELSREMRDRNWKFLGKPYGFPVLLDTIQLLLRSSQQKAA